MAIITIPTAVGGVALPGSVGQFASGPLSALFGGKSLTTFNYPTELSTDATKSHYVTFGIKEIVPASTTNIRQGASIGLNSAGRAVGAVTGLLGTVASAPGKAIADVLNSTPIGQSILADVQASPVGKLTGFLTNVVESTNEVIVTGIKTGIQVTPPIKELVSVISLYMPDTLNSDFQASWEEVSMTEELGSLIKNIRGIDQLAGKGYDAAAATSTVIGGAKAAFSAVSSDPFVQDKITKGMANFMNEKSQTLSKVLLQAAGFASNPQLQMLYKGLGVRSFQLSFTFSPKSKKEAKIVDNIIYTFKRYAAPVFASGGTVSSQSMYLIPPALFSVKFYNKGVENPFLPRYTDCVLETINVNYAPNGFAAHTDGAPIQTQLTLQFKEIEIVDRKRLELGHNGTDDAGLR